MLRFTFSIIFIIIFSTSWAVKPGFDWNEYEIMLAFGITGFYPAPEGIFKDIKEDHDLYYDSKVGPLYNKFQVYKAKDASYAVLNFRGTTSEEGSWLENLYTAMIPAKGTLILSDSQKFDYQFAADPKAALHTGWTIGFATMAPELTVQLQQLKNEGINDLYVTGHSQGGALAHMCTAWLHYHSTFNDFTVKTYASASPKVGNYYFNVDYHSRTQMGYSYNVFNSEDWVPQTFLSVQTVEDLDERNIFLDFKSQNERKGFIKKKMGNILYNKVANPSAKLSKKYQKYFGKYVYKKVLEFLPEFQQPEYANTFDYHLTGQQIMMKPPVEYHEKFTGEEDDNLLYYHKGTHYQWLLEYYRALEN